MPLVRILVGVIIGGCIVAGLLAASVRFPNAAMSVMCAAAGSFILWVASESKRSGIVGAKRSRYDRMANPFGFWFYISFYTFIGLFVMGCAVYCLLRALDAGK